MIKRRRAIDPAPAVAWGDAASIRWPVEAERHRLLDALPPAELQAWQHTRALMLLDLLTRQGAKQECRNSDTTTATLEAAA